MKDWDEYNYYKNKKIAYLIGRGIKTCPDCGFKFCTCQTKLTEFEGRCHKLLENILNRAKGDNNEDNIRRMILNLCKFDKDFKDFCIRQKILKDPKLAKGEK